MVHREEEIRREVLVKDWGGFCAVHRAPVVLSVTTTRGKKANGRKHQVLVDTLALILMIMVLPANIRDLGVWCSSSGGQAGRK